MVPQKKIYRKKISVAIDILSEISEKMIADRDKVIKLLKEKYEEYRISPFRGIAQPEDLYDKEMATLYVVGKYGMGLDEDYPEIFERVFEKEKKYEAFINAIIPEQGNGDSRARLLEKLGSSELSSNDVARILRIVFTKVIFGFAQDDELLNLMNKIEKFFPENAKDVRNFKRFFIGFKLAEMIATGEIRSRVEKEAMKQALVLKLGSGKTAPDDKYVSVIARKVFKVPGEKIEKLLSLGESGEESRKSRGEEVATDKKADG
ncbi:MAG: DUF2192 domain-containing protein [Fervidicoccaceae archaeon]